MRRSISLVLTCAALVLASGCSRKGVVYLDTGELPGEGGGRVALYVAAPVAGFDMGETHALLKAEDLPPGLWSEYLSCIWTEGVEMVRELIFEEDAVTVAVLDSATWGPSRSMPRLTNGRGCSG